MNAARHCWYEYRSAGISAIASTGYGLATAAIAESVDGRLVSWDCAYEGKTTTATMRRPSWLGGAMTGLLATA